MIFQITEAGLLAAANARENGYRLVLTRYKLGDAFGYTPTTTDTGLRGNQVHVGVFSGYYVITANQVQYLIALDESVGDFSFGEVSLELEDGTCFALGTLSEAQRKIKSSSSVVGNKITIEAKMTLTQLAAVIEFPILNITNAKFLEASSVDMLYPPVAMDTNAYLTHEPDAVGQAIICFRADNYKWSIPSFQRTLSLAVTDNGRDYTTATVNLLGGVADPADAATCEAVIENGAITAVNVLTWGKNYLAAPEVVISGDGYGAAAKATITPGVYRIDVVNGGSGYTTAPFVQLVGLGADAEAVAVITGGAVTAVEVLNPGHGYPVAPDVVFSGGGGTGATANAQITQVLQSVEVSANTNRSLLCSDLFDQLENIVPGKYLIQFLTGDLKGMIRRVESADVSTIYWAADSITGSPPAAGDVFEIYTCTALLLSDLNTKLQRNNSTITPVVAASTRNTVLIGLQTVDGVVLADGDRVLLTGQTAKATNGVWLAREGNWERPDDFNSVLNVTQGLLVPVIAGRSNKSALFSLTNRGEIQVGSEDLVFEHTQRRRIQSIAASEALVKALIMS